MVPLAYGVARWGRTIGCLYIPAMIVVITIDQDLLHVPPPATWISLVGLFVGFVLLGLWLDRRAT